MEEKINIRRSRGLTLITLVITIIVLIILARNSNTGIIGRKSV